VYGRNKPYEPQSPQTLVRAKPLTHSLQASSRAGKSRYKLKFPDSPSFGDRRDTPSQHRPNLLLSPLPATPYLINGQSQRPKANHWAGRVVRFFSQSPWAFRKLLGSMEGGANSRRGWRHGADGPPARGKEACGNNADRFFTGGWNLGPPAGGRKNSGMPILHHQRGGGWGGGTPHRSEPRAQPGDPTKNVPSTISTGRPAPLARSARPVSSRASRSSSAPRAKRPRAPLRAPLSGGFFAGKLTANTSISTYYARPPLERIKPQHPLLFGLPDLAPNPVPMGTNGSDNRLARSAAIAPTRFQPTERETVNAAGIDPPGVCPPIIRPAGFIRDSRMPHPARLVEPG